MADEENTENILSSPYDFAYDFPEGVSASEYLLRKIEENLAAGLDTGIVSPKTGRRIPYKDFDKLSKTIASGLFHKGFRAGDTVLYSSHEPGSLHVFMLGVWRANGILRASYPEDTGKILLERMEESCSKWVLCDDHLAAETLEVTRKLDWDVTVINFGAHVEGCLPAEELFNDHGDACPELEVSPDDPALILPTSGTSGPSKGAIYTHRNLTVQFVYNLHVALTNDPIQPFFLVGKLTHFSGSVFCMSMVGRGQEVLMMSSVGVQDIFDTLDNYKPRGIFVFPPLLTTMINHPNAGLHDLSCLKYVSLGGAVIGPAQLADICKLPGLKGLPTVFYGLTESGILVSNTDFDAAREGICKSLDEFQALSVGKLSPGAFLQVKDLETGRNLGAGQRGELYFKSPLIIGSYFNKPKESAEAFLNSWLRTGDVGYYDEKGFIYIVDRVKETFKYYNNHISPSEIENVLMSHPAVCQASVIGINDPDGGDKIPKGFVVLKDGGSVGVEELKAYANTRLESYKHLRGGVVLLDALPMGKTGKVLKLDLNTDVC